MSDSHKSQRFKDIRPGRLFTYKGIIFTKLKRAVGPFNAISDTRTGSKQVTINPNTVVEKLDE